MRPLWEGERQVVKGSGRDEPIWIVILSQALMIQSSTGKQYTGDLFQRIGFYSNKFTQHSPMDPNACLYYPRQPGVYSGLSQASLTL
jgi:hypothetical protein